VSVTVPPNARDTVRLPGAALGAVTEAGRAVASAPGVTRAAQDGEDVVVEVGPGLLGGTTGPQKWPRSPAPTESPPASKVASVASGAAFSVTLAVL
jgi:hypothetical protein